MTNYFTKKHFFTRKNVLLLKYTMLRICRIGFFRLDENMVEIHVQRYEQMKMLQWYECGVAYNLSAKKKISGKYLSFCHFAFYNHLQFNNIQQLTKVLLKVQSVIFCQTTIAYPDYITLRHLTLQTARPPVNQAYQACTLQRKVGSKMRESGIKNTQNRIVNMGDSIYMVRWYTF